MSDDTLYRRFRLALKSVRPLRSAWYLLPVVKEYIGDSPARSAAQFAREFENAADPWHFESAEGRERFIRVVEMLDRGSEQKRFVRAIEIGCAEGAFTEYLASRCEALLAVDFAQLALERARIRQSWPASVNFRQWNLRKDSLPEKFDLVVVMDVLSTVFRVPELKASITKVVDSLEPDGYLLFSDPRQSEVFETSWWGRYMIRGGFRILESIAQHPALTMIESHKTETHVFALFQKQWPTLAGAANSPIVEQAPAEAFEDLAFVWKPRRRQPPESVSVTGEPKTSETTSRPPKAN